MRSYRLYNAENEIEIPAMEVAFQLSGIIDSEDYDNILNLEVADVLDFAEDSFSIMRVS